MMKNKFAIWLLLILVIVPAYPCRGGRLFSIDVGYVDTESSNFGSGVIYGASIIEGTGRIGFGIAGRRFTNSILYDRSIKVGDAEAVYEYEEAFSDFYVTVLATYNLRFGDNSTHIVAGMGPQVHFVKATKYFITDGYSVAARDFRLGLGILLRLQQRIPAFGRMAFVLTSTYSWAETGNDMGPYDYQTPHESMSFPSVTAGLAFPF